MTISFKSWHIFAWKERAAMSRQWEHRIRGFYCMNLGVGIIYCLLHMWLSTNAKFHFIRNSWYMCWIEYHWYVVSLCYITPSMLPLCSIIFCTWDQSDAIILAACFIVLNWDVFHIVYILLHLFILSPVHLHNKSLLLSTMLFLLLYYLVVHPSYGMSSSELHPET